MRRCLLACVLAVLSSCALAADDGGEPGAGGPAGAYPTQAVPAAFAGYFDPPAAGTYQDSYRVVGALTPPSWSWGKLELLEGLQAYRTEGYNLRTEKQTWRGTFEDSQYPLRTYFGALNQQLVDGFNLYYQHPCAGQVGSTAGGACPANGPTRPEARFVLLQLGPRTAAGQCTAAAPPVLLVHGALQNGNVWLFPGGNDGAGGAYPGTTQRTGFVQAIEATGRCTYAVTFGSFHGDNYNQAINLANALARIKTLTGQAKVDVVAWSKGVLSVDLYAGDVGGWTDFGAKHFEQLAAEQAKRVPRFRSDVRVYVPLSGPHLGIDLNFRHPYDDLLIYSTPENAPVGQGPVTWSWMSALQCVNWGYSGVPPFPNPYAASVCAARGGTWPDYFRRIYTSNITGLDTAGRPVSSQSLAALNQANGVPSSAFSFDKYNLAMWGSIAPDGKLVSAYLGQLQAAYDLRSYYPIPNRQGSPYDWSEIDTDESKWRTWLVYKLTYLFAGFVDDDAAHAACRKTAYDPAASPCKAQHTYYQASTADGYFFGTARYRLLDGIGIRAVMEMGGNFIERLRRHGLSPSLDFLYVVHGTTAGAGAPFEYDGLACPTCDPHGDGVLFDVSIAARDQLTQGWTAAEKAARSKQEGVAHGHLEVGVSPDVWTKILQQLNSVP
ncbi:MAG: hypothetical protein R3B48_10860 [Kofleriaceae bacterium]